MKTNVCYLGDCLNVLPTLPDNSVDSIVTDPPYELGFMGKSWDNSGIAYSVPMWKECLRVLKPGGHLLSFSGTRTYHRMAVAIEDAGFEVRDMIEWCYGSGFPKSLNIGKAVDKIQGNKREVVGNSRAGSKDRNGYKGDMAIMPFETETINLDITKGTSEYEGWGTALKPAHEPICLARKPLAEKTVAENVLKYGTGGINIDESRVGTEVINIHNAPKGTFAGGEPDRGSDTESYRDSVGRFPANLCHDNSEEVRECFPETKTGSIKPHIQNLTDRPFQKNTSKEITSSFSGDSGNASRFFKSILYYPKASKSERNKGCEELEEKEFYKMDNDHGNLGHFMVKKAGGEIGDIQTRKNNHPTVKPIALMEYLIKMITPKGGVVLDPFAGSGSTLVAAKDNGFQYIGIEMTEEYLPIIQARTGCEIIKPDYIKVDKETFKDLKFEIKVKPEIVIDKTICPQCGGKIKGKYCEDCFYEVVDK